MRKAKNNWMIKAHYLCFAVQYLYKIINNKIINTHKIIKYTFYLSRFTKKYHGKKQNDFIFFQRLYKNLFKTLTS